MTERLGVPERAARTAAGLGLVVWFVLPISRWLFGELRVDFSIFILSGLMIVIGASWTIMYNADLLLGRADRGRWAGSARLAPVLRMSMAYPLAKPVPHRCHPRDVHARRVHARDRSDDDHVVRERPQRHEDLRRRVRHQGDRRRRRRPSPTCAAALQQARGIDPADFRVVSSQSFLPVKAHQAGAPGGARGLRRARPQHRLPHATRPTGSRRGRRASTRTLRCGARWTRGRASR